MVAKSNVWNIQIQVPIRLVQDWVRIDIYNCQLLKMCNLFRSFSLCPQFVYPAHPRCPAGARWRGWTRWRAGGHCSLTSPPGPGQDSGCLHWPPGAPGSPPSYPGPGPGPGSDLHSGSWCTSALTRPESRIVKLKHDLKSKTFIHTHHHHHHHHWQ